MQRYLFALLILAFASCSNDNDANKDKKSNLLPTSLVNNPHTAMGLDTAAMNAKPTMDFVDTFHAFGSMHEGEKVVYNFEFKNNGKNPLVISNALGSCGCTVADYQRDPIAPGAGGVMKVIFNSAGKSGHQEKSVQITTNSNKGTHMLYITAEVIPQKDK